MENCTNCEHAVFDEKWGEYKCKKLEHRMYILLDSTECPNYKKKKEEKKERENENNNS